MKNDLSGVRLSSPGPAPPGSNPATPLASLSYGYNPLGEMTSYSGPSGGSPLSIASSAPGALQHMAPGMSSKTSATYAYDPSGLLASETSTTTGPPGPSCAPAPPAGARPPESHRADPSCTTTTTTAFTWSVAGSIPAAVQVGAYYYVYGPGGAPIEQIGPNASTLSYLANRQGSTVALVDTKGQVVARYAYSAYGSLTCGPRAKPGASPRCHPSPADPPVPPATCPAASANSPAGPPPCTARAIAANRFLYDGQYLDAASGLYYLRARWYDAATGQFTSVDALVAITGAAYGYAGGNPVNGGDPSGMFSIPSFLDPLFSLYGLSTRGPKFACEMGANGFGSYGSSAGCARSAGCGSNTQLCGYVFSPIVQLADTQIGNYPVGDLITSMLLITWYSLYQPNPAVPATTQIFSKYGEGIQACQSVTDFASFSQCFAHSFLKNGQNFIGGATPGWPFADRSVSFFLGSISANFAGQVVGFVNQLVGVSKDAIDASLSGYVPSSVCVFLV